MTHRPRAAASLVALFLVVAASGPALATDPAPTPQEQQKPAEPASKPPAKPAEQSTKKSDKSSGSGAKQAGRGVANTFKKFGHDVGDFFDGLFNSDK